MAKENPKKLAPKVLTALLTAVLVFPTINDSLAVNTGYTSDTTPASTSAKEIESNFEGSKSKKEEKLSIFPTFKEKMESLPPFWRDTNLNLHFRSYYFYRDNVASHKSEAWALRFSLVFTRF